MRELLPLLKADHAENGVRDVPLDINVAKYLDYDLLGVLQIITARDDGILVGYVMAFVHPHIDHGPLGWAIISWYWIYPEYRKQGVGGFLFECMLKFLREAKVRVVEASEKIAHKHGLFERLGFKPTDTIYRKVMKD